MSPKDDPRLTEGSDTGENINALTAQWVAKAESDWQAAEYLLAGPSERLRDAVCFHAQQCVEKYLKALLVSKQLQFPRTHDLSVLAELVRKADIVLTDVESSRLSELNRYGVEIRYPDYLTEVSRDEAVEAVTIAKTVRAAVHTYLPQEAVRTGTAEAAKMLETDPDLPNIDF